MHLFTSISLVSLLLFTCFGSLASRPDASLRIKRDVDVTGDVLIEQDGAANVMEIQSDQQISNLELNQMISEHSHLHQESPGQSKSSELESHYSQHYNSKSGSLRGLRCGPELFTRHNLQEAANKGCELLKKKKKTFGFKRYPSRYEGSLDEPHSTFSEENSPEGPFYIYPVLKNEKIYSFGRSGPYRVVFNNDCEVVGARVSKKTMNKCTTWKCHIPFLPRTKVFSACLLDYYQ